MFLEYNLMIIMKNFVKKKRKFNEIEYEYYEINNDKSNNTLILPGWQQNFETYQSIYGTIKRYSNIYIISFPGFKNTIQPLKPLTLNDYVDIVNDLIVHLNLNSLLIMGHSFGGRVAIKLQSIYKKANYLILVSSAGLKNYNLINKIKVFKYKIKKWFLYKISKQKYYQLIKTSGSPDYIELSDTMKETFKNIINEDLQNCLKKIQIPTLLMWGSQDKTTPLKMGKKFLKKMNNSELVVLKGCGHFSFLESKREFNLILDAFYKNIWGDKY